MGCRGLFVVGTDTGVGKTYVSCLILRRLLRAGITVGAYKPVCSGAVAQGDHWCWEDVEQLAHAAGLDESAEFPRTRICPQTFLAPLAPPRAARLEGKCVDVDLLESGLRWWQTQVEWLLIEGAGGLLSPLTETESVADVADRWGYPVLLVARTGLGTLNHTLLSLEACQSRGLNVVGVLLNQTDPSEDSRLVAYNFEDLQRLNTVPVWGPLLWQETEFPCEARELFDFSAPNGYSE